MADSDAFPTLQFDDAPAWSWPTPPGAARRYAAPAAIGTPQPCRIETRNGQCLQGEMLDFDPAKRRLVFRASAAAPQASLPFGNLRRLTLTVPLAPLPRAAGAPKEHAASAAQLRDYTLELLGARDAALVNAQPLTGRTAGHVESGEGLYLFSPHGEDGARCRVFVPRSAYSRCEFGASDEEIAARHWIASPTALLDALARQPTQAVTPLGQALLALGLLTPTQLQRALQRLDGATPLGEALVQGRQVSRNDLQTALAHKMGYPLVDVQRFPIDPQATALLPRRLCIAHRMLPLMRDGPRLVVAVDRPGRVRKLCESADAPVLGIVPVLALKAQILRALQRQAGDGWSVDPSQRVAFVSTEF